MISFLSVSLLLFYSLRREPRVSFGRGVRHYFITLAAALVTAESADTAFYELFHPSYAVSYFYVPMGFAPAWLYFSLMVTSMLLGVFIWVESAAAAARKSRSRTAFIWIWPIYVAIMLVRVVITVQAHGGVNRLHEVVADYTLGIAFIALIGLLVFLHFHSSHSNDLFFPKTSA
jgi:hypothetical protein